MARGDLLYQINVLYAYSLDVANGYLFAAGSGYPNDVIRKYDLNGNALAISPYLYNPQCVHASRNNSDRLYVGTGDSGGNSIKVLKQSDLTMMAGAPTFALPPGVKAYYGIVETASWVIVCASNGTIYKFAIAGGEVVESLNAIGVTDILDDTETILTSNDIHCLNKINVPLSISLLHDFSPTNVFAVNRFNNEYYIGENNGGGINIYDTTYNLVAHYALAGTARWIYADADKIYVCDIQEEKISVYSNVTIIPPATPEGIEALCNYSVATRVAGIGFGGTERYYSFVSLCSDGSNVFAIGTATGIIPGIDQLLVKLDSTGLEVLATNNLQEYRTDYQNLYFKSICLAGEYIYVVGNVYLNNRAYPVIFKLDKTLNIIKSKIFYVQGTSNAVASFESICSIGSFLYAVGYTNQEGNNNYGLAVKLDTELNIILKKLYGDENSQRFTGIAPDGNNLFVWGRSAENSLIMKFDVDLTILLSKEILDAYGWNDSLVPLGSDLYVVGATYDETWTYCSSRIIKLDSSFNIVAQKVFGGAGYDELMTVATDGISIYAAGGTADIDWTYSYGTVLKIDASLNILYFKIYKSIAAGKYEWFDALYIYDDAHIYVAGDDDAELTHRTGTLINLFYIHALSDKYSISGKTLFIDASITLQNSSLTIQATSGLALQDSVGVLQDKQFTFDDSIGIKTNLFLDSNGTSTGSTGSGDGQLNTPKDIMVSNDETKILIVDSGNNRIQIFNAADNAYFSQFGSSGSGDGQFYNPTAIASDANYYYIADAGNNRIQIFDAATNEYIGQFGSAGSGDGLFNNPISLAVDDNYIYVVDNGNNRVNVYNKISYKFVGSVGGYGSALGFFDNPTSITIGGGFVYVADYNNNRVQLFSYFTPLAAPSLQIFRHISGSALLRWPNSDDSTSGVWINKDGVKIAEVPLYPKEYIDGGYAYAESHNYNIRAYLRTANSLTLSDN